MSSGGFLHLHPSSLLLHVSLISHRLILLSHSYIVAGFVAAFSFYFIIPVFIQDVPVFLLSTYSPKRLLNVMQILSESLYPLLETTGSFDFSIVHQIRKILLRNNISLASSSFCSCLKIVQAPQPLTRTGSTKCSTAPLTV